MQVVFHLGAHCTDEDRLLKCVLKNQDMLRADGIAAPGPGKYRAVLREAVLKLRGAPAPLVMQDQVQDKIMGEGQRAERLVFSNQSFLCATDKVFQQGKLYALAGERAQWLSQVFPDDEIELFLGIRNPATFVPAVYGRCKGLGFDDFLSGADPRAMRWSEVVADIRRAVPRAVLTVWANEDTPLLWTQLLAELSGLDPDAAARLEGADDFLASIMSASGMARMREYLAEHPPVNEIQRRRVLAAFLDKFALEEEVEMELDLPGWTELLVEEITEDYEEDLFRLERMPGVDFITP